MTVQCDGHDAPAAHEAHWTDLSDPRDPRGAATAFCADAACRARVLADVDRHGVLIEVVDVAAGAGIRTARFGVDIRSAHRVP